MLSFHLLHHIRYLSSSRYFPIFGYPRIDPPAKIWGYEIRSETHPPRKSINRTVLVWVVTLENWQFLFKHENHEEPRLERGSGLHLQITSPDRQQTQLSVPICPSEWLVLIFLSRKIQVVKKQVNITGKSNFQYLFKSVNILDIPL